MDMRSLKPKAFMRLEVQLIKALQEQASGGKAFIPPHAKPVWDAFLALSRTRRYNSFGPEAITYQEIAAFRNMMGIPLQAHHIAIITALDAGWLKEAQDVREKASGGVATRAPTVPMSGELFDAVFT